MEESSFVVDHEQVKIMIVSNKFETKEEANMELIDLMRAAIDCLETNLPKVKNGNKKRTNKDN